MAYETDVLQNEQRLHRQRMQALKNHPLARKRERQRHQQRMCALGMCRENGTVGKFVMGADPSGYPGYWQLDRMVQGKSYVPTWLYGPAPWPTKYPKRTVAWSRLRKKADKRTKKFHRWVRGPLRKKKGSTFQKYAARLKQETMRYYQVPEPLIDRWLASRGRWVVKRQKQRGIQGAVNKAKQVASSAAKIAKKSVYLATKVVGPAIATVYPPAGPVIKRGLKVLSDAQKGVTKAVSKVKAIEKAAKAGLPKGKAALDVLQAARELQKQINGEKPPAPGAVVIDKARLLQEATQKGYGLFDPRA